MAPSIGSSVCQWLGEPVNWLMCCGF
jgi:hypothetical protein